MPKNINDLWVFRIIHRDNLEYILQNGIYYRNSFQTDPNYINIGSSEIINHRDTVPVKCYENRMVNEYVPFYFGVRTPMLYKIKTGNGVPKREQDEIIYLCCKVSDFVNSDLEWCFTDGNAAKYITRFYKDIQDLNKLDFRSIDAIEWSDNNSDGDHDRMRKKHSEFLVRSHVPVEFIKGIVAYNQLTKVFIDAMIHQYQLPISVWVNPQNKFYY